MDKSPDAFRTISEVAEWLGVQAHVLRFWESKFSQVKPVKRAGGRRYYRPGDMELLGGIKKLLHDDGLTIKGVQKILREQGVAHVSSLSQDLGDVAGESAKTIVPKPVQADPIEASVVPFKSGASKPATPDPEPVVTPEPEVIVETAPFEQPTETEPDVAEVAAPVEQEPPAPVEPAPVEPTPVDVEDEKPVLPSFLHRPARTEQPAPTPEPEPVPEPIVAEKRAIVVDAPDPADDADLPYNPGPLAHLAGLDSLSAQQIARIAPLTKELQAWLARAAH